MNSENLVLSIILYKDMMKPKLLTYCGVLFCQGGVYRQCGHDYFPQSIAVHTPTLLSF